MRRLTDNYTNYSNSVGDLRLRLPIPFGSYKGAYSAANFGSACPQQVPTLPLPPSPVTNAVNFFAGQLLGGGSPAEDCMIIGAHALSIRLMGSVQV